MHAETLPRITTASFCGRAQWAIFAAAFLIRLIFVYQFATQPVNDLLWNDAVGWNLAQGNGFTASQGEPRIPGIFRSPGYPAFLAAIYSIFGHSYYAVYVAQALLDAASAIVIGRIASLYWNPGMATLSAILYAIYPYPAMFCGVLHQDILLVFCTLVSIQLTSKAIKNPNNIALWGWSGLCFGITALVKPNLGLLIVVAGASLWFYLSEARLRRSLLLIAAFTFTILPWVIRNYMVFGSFPPLAAGATGTNLKLVVVELNRGEEAVRDIGLAPPRTSVNVPFTDGKLLIESEKKKTQESIRILEERWPEYLVLIGKHIPRQWITQNSRWHGSFVAFSGKILSWIVLVFGVAGMILERRQWRNLLPLYATIVIVTLMYAPYTAEARYTLPARPIMLCFVAITCMALLRLRILQPLR